MPGASTNITDTGRARSAVPGLVEIFERGEILECGP